MTGFNEGNEAKGDSDAASSLFALLDYRINDLSGDEGLLEDVAEAVTSVGNRQEWFNADAAIYGSFSQKAARLLKKLAGS